MFIVLSLFGTLFAKLDLWLNKLVNLLLNWLIWYDFLEEKKFQIFFKYWKYILNLIKVVGKHEVISVVQGGFIVAKKQKLYYKLKVLRLSNVFFWLEKNVFLK